MKILKIKNRHLRLVCLLFISIIFYNCEKDNEPEKPPAPTTNIPDSKFEQALIDLGIDTNGKNGNILNSDAVGVDTLKISSKRISSLYGIEAFTSLTFLDCRENSLSRLDVSKNTALEFLDCGNNSLTALDVSANTTLTFLNCEINRLSTLDVSKNTDLIVLWCNNNSLSSLDVSVNTALAFLSCRDNSLLTLDVSQNTALTFLWCFNNQLTSLNVKNGNNANFKNNVNFVGHDDIIASSFKATGNPNLSCIQVDDVGYSRTNWTDVDATTIFSTDCSNDVLIGGWAIIDTKNQEIPIIFVNADNQRISILDSDEDDIFDGFIITEGDDSIDLKFDEESKLPISITTSEGDIVLFNYKENNTLLDIAIIKRDESIEYIRDIAIDIPEYQSSLSSLKFKTNKEYFFHRKIFKATKIMSFVWGAAVCGTSLAATLGTGGVASPLLLTCVPFVLELIPHIAQASNIELHENVSEGLRRLSSGIDIFQCTIGDFFACAGVIAEGVLFVENSFRQTRENMQDLINLAGGALISGYGILKMTLTWDTINDIDLWVTYPYGERIYWDHPYSASGGILDYDFIYGYGSENIFWEDNAPHGRYYVKVHYYKDNGGGVTNYAVQLQVQGRTYIRRGTLVNEKDLDDVFYFDFPPSGRSSTITKLSKSIAKVITSTEK